jgi:glycosyltransferase involved in cell wall biosynthesis
MRLLHVIRSTDPAGGGPIEVVRQFSRAHLEQGHSVEVASLDLSGQQFSGDSDLPTHRLGTSAGSYGRSPRFVPWLRARAEDYDAVIVHGLWQFQGRGTREALRGTGTPYFIYPHGMLDPWFRRAYPLKHLKKAIYWRLVEHRVLRDAAAVLYTCEEERRLAQNTFRPCHATERVVPLGIAAPPGDADHQRELFLARFPELRGKRLLLFLGRLHDKKGCDLVIRAFAKVVCSPFPSKLQTSDFRLQPWHLVMAGPCADANYLESLKHLAASLNLPILDFPTSNSARRFPESDSPTTGSPTTTDSPITVSFPGMLSGHLKWGAYRAADAFVLPSHQENFGIAVVEALACGLPVLISNKVNIWREIEADRGGLIAEDSLEGTLRLLHSWSGMKEQDRAAMRVAANSCFQNRFLINAASMSLIRLLKDFCAKKTLHVKSGS